MNQKLSARLLSILLCAAVLFGMVPAVSAATVSSVAITGVSVPAAGASPSASASVPADSGYTVASVSWVGWERGQSDVSAVSGSFEGGWYYQVQIVLNAAGDTQFDPAVTATVNGQNGEVSANSGTSVTVKHTFYVEPAANTPISSVAVSGLTAPAAGQSPDYNASGDGSTYSVYQINWSRTDTGISTGISQNDKFVAGGRYQVIVILEAAPGYSFADSVSCTIDGKSAICGNFQGLPREQFIGIVCEYTVTSENQITQVAVSDLSTPVKGAAPDMSVTVASSAQYLVESVAWKKWKTGADSSSAVNVTSQEKFQSGYHYRVQIVLRAKSDAIFATDSTGAPTVTGTVNGNAALPAVSVTGKNASQYICICYDFSLSVKLIQSVKINDVFEPFVGDSPSNRTRISPEDPYTVAQVYWEMCDVSRNPGEFTQMNSFAIFAGGMSYRVNVVLQAKDGAEFAAGEDREPKVSATINGEKAKCQAYAGKDPTAYICVSYDFPVLTDSIQHVDVYKIDEPKEGRYPDFEAEVPEDALYLADRISWEVWDQETGEYIKMSAYDQFEENHEYRVVIRMAAKKGGEFYVNQFGELQVTATVNGQPTIPAEPAENLDPKEYVLISYDYNLSSDAKEIRRVNLHDLDIPVAGATPDYSVNTDAVAKYTVDSVIWQRMQNRRSNSAAEELTADSVFEEGQYYRVQIILKAGQNTVFHTNDAGRPQVTAVLNNGNGMAAESVPGKDPHEYVCVSYTYGIYSVIEGGDGQWSPEKGTLKFRFTGEFENFVGVRVDGKMLHERMYTAASGSTIITLQESFLNTLADGIYELTVLYTDGQVSTKFQVSGGAVSEAEGGFHLNAWFFVLPPVVGILAGLFFAAFIIKKRTENRVHKERFEEYDEDDDDFDDE